jgi:hypothetical protein
MTTTQNPFGDLAEFQRWVAETQRPFQEIREQLAQTLKKIDLTGVAETQRHLQGMSEQLAQTLKQIDLTPCAKFSKQALESIQNAAQGTYAPLVEAMAKYAIAAEKRRLLDDSGWLPHATLPTSLIDQCGDDATQLSRSFAEYYVENWPKVRQLCT